MNEIGRQLDPVSNFTPSIIYHLNIPPVI